jgi:hypothetical protein
MKQVITYFTQPNSLAIETAIADFKEGHLSKDVEAFDSKRE